MADHASTTRSYAAAAIARGVEVTEGCTMAAMESRGDRVQAVITDAGERIEPTRGVILLTNSEVASQLEALTGLVLPLWNANLQVLVSEPLPSVPLNHLIGHVSRTVSLKIHGTDRLMISGGWFGEWDDEAKTGRIRQASVAGNVEQTIALYPSLAGIEIAVADVAHLESMSVDDIPIIDTVLDLPNLWFGAGWSGHGWAIAPVVAEQLATWCDTGTKPELLEPFRLARFSRV